MIVVDSSVWIDHFGGRRSAQVTMWDRLVAVRACRSSWAISLCLRSAVRVRLDSPGPCSQAMVRVTGSGLDARFRGRAAGGRDYYTLRRHGITPGTIDMIIGTYCIEMGTELLTADRDFAPMRYRLGFGWWRKGEPVTAGQCSRRPPPGWAGLNLLRRRASALGAGLRLEPLKAGMSLGFRR